MAMATDRVLIPILPINMLSINIILLGSVRVKVNPAESPTVPKADIVSKRASVRLHFSKISRPIVENNTRIRAVKVRVSAL